MDVLILTIFVSLVLVSGGAMFFAWIVRQRTFDQSERLALLPLSDERTVPEDDRGEDTQILRDNPERPLGND